MIIINNSKHFQDSALKINNSSWRDKFMNNIYMWENCRGHTTRERGRSGDASYNWVWLVLTLFRWTVSITALAGGGVCWPGWYPLREKERQDNTFLKPVLNCGERKAYRMGLTQELLYARTWDPICKYKSWWCTIFTEKRKQNMICCDVNWFLEERMKNILRIFLLFSR